MAARFGADPIGALVWKTTSAVSPDRAGNLDCRMSAACCEGVFPAVKSFWKRVPTTWAIAVTPMTRRIQSEEHRPSVVVAPSRPAAQGGRGAGSDGGPEGRSTAVPAVIVQALGFIIGEFYHRIHYW